MDHGLPIELHVDLNIAHGRPLLIDIALDLVMARVKLEEVYRRGLFGLPFEKFGHELYLLELPGELYLITFQDGRLLLHLNHQLVHALLQYLGDLSLDILCVGANQPKLLLN